VTEAIALNAITKNFGSVEAVRGITLSVPQGEAFCLLGPNGAGKTTTINLMLGLTQPTAGSVSLFGHPPHSRAARQKVGLVAQDTDFPETLTPREILHLVRAHSPEPVSEDELIDIFGLAAIVDRHTGGFSGGQRRRLGLELAFAGRGKVIFLDEPTTGLDAAAREAFWTYAQDRRDQGATLVITTHYLHDIEAIAERICLIDQGLVRLDGSVAEIRSRIQRRIVRFQTDVDMSFDRYGPHQRDGANVTFSTADADILVTNLIRDGVAFSQLEVLTASLEEAIAAIGGAVEES